MNEQENKEKSRQKNRILAIVCAVGFVLCIAWVIWYLAGIRRAGNQIEDLKEEYVEETVQPEEQVTEEPEKTVSENIQETEGRVQLSLEGYDVPDKKIDFNSLQAENPDIYAWITIPGTVIDYPIVQDTEELDYYLNHNLDGSSGYPGCIYTQYYNTKDWSDNNTVIYGHNMKNGTMFAGLHQYKDEEFFAQNPFVYIYTPDETLVYQIFAAYETGDEHILITYDMETPENYQAYLGAIMDKEETVTDHVDASLAVNKEDKIISMETCIGNKPTKRYLVQAVLVAKASVQQ